MEYLGTSVQYLIPPWNIYPPPWNISFLRGIFNPLCGIFHTSVEYLTPSVESWIPAWNV